MTSGIRDVEDAQPWQAQLASIAKDPLLFTPGTETSYSNSNYLTCSASSSSSGPGKSTAPSSRTRILDPLGMSADPGAGPVRHGPEPGGRLQRAPAREVAEGRLRNGAAMYAAAGMVSTAQDMATYMTALLAGRILDPATYAMMWTATPTPQYGVESRLRGRARTGMGYGDRHERRARPRSARAGRSPDTPLQLILYPSSDSGVFVSINTA